MNITVGTNVHRTVSSTIEGGLIEMIRIERRTVVDTSVTVTLGELTCLEFPSHTPPESLEWPSPISASTVHVSASDIGSGKSWDTSEPVLPVREEIDDAQVEADYLEWTNQKFVARDTGRSRPVITDEQRRLFLIHEYRFGLLAL